MGLSLGPRSKMSVEMRVWDYRKLMKGEEIEMRITMPDGTVVPHAIAKRNLIRNAEGQTFISIELPEYHTDE